MDSGSDRRLSRREILVGGAVHGAAAIYDAVDGKL
jgi:hypothetical protein